MPGAFIQSPLRPASLLRRLAYLYRVLADPMERNHPSILVQEKMFGKIWKMETSNHTPSSSPCAVTLVVGVWQNTAAPLVPLCWKHAQREMPQACRAYGTACGSRRSGCNVPLGPAPAETSPPMCCLVSEEWPHMGPYDHKNILTEHSYQP